MAPTTAPIHMEFPVGFEPTKVTFHGFAARRLTTWLRKHNER